jgi:hypothetical protein
MKIDADVRRFFLPPPAARQRFARPPRQIVATRQFRTGVLFLMPVLKAVKTFGLARRTISGVRAWA